MPPPLLTMARHGHRRAEGGMKIQPTIHPPIGETTRTMVTPRTMILPPTGGRTQTAATTTVSDPRKGKKFPPLNDDDDGRGEPTGGGAGRMLHYLQAGEGIQWTPPLPNNQ